MKRIIAVMAAVLLVLIVAPLANHGSRARRDVSVVRAQTVDEGMYQGHVVGPASAPAVVTEAEAVAAVRAVLGSWLSSPDYTAEYVSIRPLLHRGDVAPPIDAWKITWTNIDFPLVGGGTGPASIGTPPPAQQYCHNVSVLVDGATGKPLETACW